MTSSWKSSTVAFYFALVLLFGGASAGGLLANTVLQLLGAGIVALCLSSYRPHGASLLRLSAIAFAIFGALQFLPMPPSVWMNLPGRSTIANGFELLSVAPPWLTLSLSPLISFQSIVWLIPAFAMYIALRSDQAVSPVQITIIAAVIAITGVGLSAMQVLNESLYIYDVTNYGMGVGFFANANHQGNFLLTVLVLTVATVANTRKVSTGDTRVALRLTSGGIAFLLILGIVLSNSLACLGLLVATMVALVFLLQPQLRFKRTPVVFGSIGVAILLLLLALYGPSNDLTQAQSGDTLNRRAFFANGWDIALAHAPVGSGVGTFAAIYRTFEEPEQVTNFFVNHAHNDYLELLIEGGIFAFVPILLFLLWFTRSAFSLWRTARDRPYKLAGTIIVGIELLHSLVDYPLRTAALSTMLVVGICLMLSDRQEGRRAPRTRHTKARANPNKEDLVRL